MVSFASWPCIGEALLKAKPVAKKVCPPKLSKMAMLQGSVKALFREALEQKQVIFKEALCALGFEPKKEDPIL